MLSRFFIDRPIFAWVIAIVVMLVGAVAMRTLPIAQFPDIAPPAISVSAVYPGAAAQTLENSVTQVIEQQLKGLDGLLYFSASSSSNGSVQITASFAPGTNPDIAQVQVQNRVQAATPLLPQEVQQQGVTVSKVRSNYLMIVGIYDETDRSTSSDMSDILVSNFQDPLARVDGVGNLQVFGSQYAMRIWLDPFKLNNFRLTPADVRTAVQAQNSQVGAGQIGGQPTVKGQEINATVTAQSRLRTADQFRGIILRTGADGSLVRLGDVARVELGSETYDSYIRMNRHPASGAAVILAPGANALRTADAVKARINQLAANLPPGVKVAIGVDNTRFVRISIRQVAQTLVEAIILVVLVMFLFLQNWRTTLIPALAVPVVLLGVFGVLAALNYSINTLTLFAMVLAIGLLVDDAIVVIENVERIMSEEGLSPREAAKKSMGQISGALIGIALVLTAVLTPMAFFSGSTGVIYRQFSVTMVAAVLLSVVVALVLTPALCATLLKPAPPGGHSVRGGFFGWFNRRFAGLVARYDRGLGRVIGRPLVALVGYALVIALMIPLFLRLPAGFLPQEDQGQLYSLVTLPAGAVQARTTKALDLIEHQYLDNEGANVETLFVANGFSFAGQGQNLGIGYVTLRDWSERKGRANSAAGIAGRAMGAFSKFRDGQIFPLVPPAVPDLGQVNGFDLQLQDRGGLGHERFLAARNQLLGLAARDPKLAAVRPNGVEDAPQVQVDVDLARAGALGLSQGDINGTLSAAFAAAYINDFIDRGRVKRVYMQGDAPYRMSPDDLGDWYVRNASGAMTPFSAFSNSRWMVGPTRLERFNGVPSFNIQGQAAPGVSSGAAMDEIEALVKKLPAGIGFEWSGLSYQERAGGSQAPLLYGFSILVVFLCLAALYESWSTPLAVVLVLPLGVAGAFLATNLRGLNNDIYFQVGLLTTMGLTAKNAILIVEFADGARKRGEDVLQAAVQGAKLRLRPIIMTSMAFVAGVIPLAVASGAGAGSQNAIGTGVIGGMLAGTVLTIFFTPLFFVVIERLVGRRRQGGEERAHP